MSSNCLFQGADVFKMAIAVAPVTSWRYYDSIYTERYMQTPQENASGYDNNSPINHVSKLKGNFLLVHGTADDNLIGLFIPTKTTAFTVEKHVYNCILK